MENKSECGSSSSRVALLPFQELIVGELNPDDHLCLLASGLCWQKLLAVFLRAHEQAVNAGWLAALNAAYGSMTLHILSFEGARDDSGCGEGCQKHRLFAGLAKGAVVILGAAAWEKNLLVKEMLRHHPDSRLPIDVTNEVPMAERVGHYQQSRCCFVTTRIFVVDLLAGRVATKDVLGIVVLNAHRVKDTSGEGFAVRIYRKGNPSGFVRGFSDQPTCFSGGFGKVEKVMKALHIRKLSLWPRFHSVVRDDLEKNPIEVVEICEDLSVTMRLIQDGIMATVGSLIKELKRTNKIDSSELNLENGMFKSFDDIIKRQLDSIWHTVSWKTKQIVQDLRQLRKLSVYLLRYDCVTFLSFLERMRAVGPQSVWLFHDASHTIFEQAKRRVYVLSSSVSPSVGDSGRKTNKPSKTKSQWKKRTRGVAQSNTVTPPSQPVTAQPVLEELPKWGSLRDVLHEIQRERESTPFSGGPSKDQDERPKILVVCKELYMCKQLVHIVSDPKGFSKRMFDMYLTRRYAERIRERKAGKWYSRRPGDIEAAIQAGGAGTTDLEDEALARRAEKILSTSEVPSESLDDCRVKRHKQGSWIRVQNHQAVDDFRLEEVAACESTVDCPLLSGVHFLALDSHDPFLLWELDPDYVVMYDLDVAFLRQLEVFKAEDPNHAVRLYLLSYKESLEQYKYKSSIQREIEVFTDLIQNKSRITIPIDLDAAQQPNAVLEEATGIQMGVGQGSILANNKLTRRAGGRKLQTPQSYRIVVDMREFVSNLPAVLDEKGFKIDPVFLEVGDYVLSPEIVVERKSLQDLFLSLPSGRLYHQAELMSKYYKTPILLIEFEQDKEFGLQSVNDIGQEISPRSISSKLVLLTLHFPRLRIIWSRSLHATADIFLSLKSNQDEPDPHLAASVPNTAAASGDLVVNQQAVELLRKLPGVTDGNFRLIMGACNCLADLADIPLEDLEQIMGSKRNAKFLREFLDAPAPRHLL